MEQVPYETKLTEELHKFLVQELTVDVISWPFIFLKLILASVLTIFLKSSSRLNRKSTKNCACRLSAVWKIRNR